MTERTMSDSTAGDVPVFPGTLADLHTFYKRGGTGTWKVYDSQGLFMRADHCASPPEGPLDRIPIDVSGSRYLDHVVAGTHPFARNTTDITKACIALVQQRRKTLAVYSQETVELAERLDRELTRLREVLAEEVAMGAM